MVDTPPGARVQRKAQPRRAEGVHLKPRWPPGVGWRDLFCGVRTASLAPPTACRQCPRPSLSKLASDRGGTTTTFCCRCNKRLLCAQATLAVLRVLHARIEFKARLPYAERQGEARRPWTPRGTPGRAIKSREWVAVASTAWLNEAASRRSSRGVPRLRRLERIGGFLPWRIIREC